MFYVIIKFVEEFELFIEFKEIKFKNFLSFGNNLTTFSFEHGLNLMTGKNGGGKSGSLLDPLSFCIFGKPYRKIKIRELLNRTNKKKLYTECTFIISKDEYKIIRTQLPDSIEIYKNGTSLDLESSKKIIQDEINKLIGIDYNMFRQIIALAINYNKSFLEMDFNEKREIIESITNVKILGEMLKLTKIEISNIKTQIGINENSLKFFEENLYSTNKRIEDLKLAKQNFEEDKTKDLNKIENKIKSQEREVLTIQNEIEKINYDEKIEEKLENELKKLQKKIEKINKEINIQKFKKETAENIIIFLSKNEICQMCNQSLSKEHKQIEENTQNEIIKNCESSIKINEKNKKQINEQIKEIKKQIKEEIEAKNKNINLNEKIDWYVTEIKSNIQRKKEIKDRQITVDIDALEEEFNNKKLEYLQIYDDNEDKKNSLNNYKIISSIISDDGIKAHFFRKIMPILNNKINENLKKFDMPIRIEIDEFLNDKIYGLNIKNQEISYFSHSEGEKKRIDISILLAFIEITKIICNWDCSLLIFDEILDAKVDDDGLEIMINSLKNLKVKNDKLSAYIISHRMQDSDIFDRHYRVSKASGFSKIEQLY
jgi:DNA repair exonuclease SbcCD ATPase subunit